MLISDHIVITGGSGFIGKHLSVALLANGFRVTQLVRSIVPGCQYEQKQIAFDLNDRKKVQDCIATLQPNYAIHLASSKDRINSKAGFRDSYEKNVSMSLNLIDACLNLSDFKRLVFLGSCDEYGQASSPFDESQREIPANAYGLSKLAVTKILSGLYHSFQFPSVILRPTVIYGPGQGDEMFLPALVNSLLMGKEFAMTSGEQMRDFIYVDDVVEAIIKALNADEHVNGKVINIGAGVASKIKNIATLVADSIHPDILKLIKFGAVQYRANEVMDYSVVIARAKELLGWYPKTSMESGIQSTIKYFKDSGCRRLS